jgi:hypothetical protein
LSTLWRVGVSSCIRAIPASNAISTLGRGTLINVTAVLKGFQ